MSTKCDYFTKEPRSAWYSDKCMHFPFVTIALKIAYALIPMIPQVTLKITQFEIYSIQMMQNQSQE